MMSGLKEVRPDEPVPENPTDNLNSTRHRASQNRNVRPEFLKRLEAELEKNGDLWKKISD
jgi:hypothetical protein